MENLLYDLCKNKINDINNCIVSVNYEKSTKENINKLMNYYINNMYNDIKNREYKIKTQFGSINTVIINSNLGVISKYESKLLSFIMNNMIKYNMSFEELLSTIDIGLIVKENKIYYTIDKEVAKWLYNINADLFLYGLASGYPEYIIDMYDYDQFIRKYVKLFKGYAIKKKMLCDDNNLNLVNQLAQLCCEVDLGNLGKCNISKIDISNKINWHLTSNIKELFNLTVDAHDRYVYFMLYGGDTISQMMSRIKRGVNPDGFDPKGFEYSRLQIKIASLCIKYNIEINNDTTVINEYRSTKLSSTGLEYVCYKFDIQFNRVLVRLCNNIDICDAIEIGIKEREEIGIHYAFEDTTRDILGRIARNV